MDKTIIKMKRLTIEIDTDLHSKAKLGAYQEGKTIKAKLVELLRGWLKI